MTTWNVFHSIKRVEEEAYRGLESLIVYKNCLKSTKQKHLAGYVEAAPVGLCFLFSYSS